MKEIIPPPQPLIAKTQIINEPVRTGAPVTFV